MSFARKLAAFLRGRKGSPGDKGALGTANDNRAPDKTNVIHGKPGPQPTDSKSSASAKDEKLAPESKRSMGAKESVDEKFAPESKRSLKGRTEPVTDPTKNPWPALCFVRINFDYESPGNSFKKTIEGSGFFVSDTMVITCAHNLCEFDEKTRECITPTSISIRPSNSDVAVDVKCSPLSTRFAKQYEKCLKDELGDIKYHYDYGAIFLSPGQIKPVPPFCFAIEGIEPEDPRWDKPLTCAGYFQDPPQSTAPIDLYFAQGAATSKDRFQGEAHNLVRHSAQARGGQSGGPLFAVDDNRVVGIQVWALPDFTYGAVRITGDMVRLFKVWEREYRESPAFLRNREDLIA